MAASEGVHVLKVHASLIEIHIQVRKPSCDGPFFTLMNLTLIILPLLCLYSLVSYVPIHVIMLVICRVEMHQDATLTPVSDCVVYYYPE